jgi:hypothetical protein
MPCRVAEGSSPRADHDALGDRGPRVSAQGVGSDTLTFWASTLNAPLLAL